MWIHIFIIYFVIKNGCTSSLRGSFQTAFDGCYGIQGWSLVTEDNVRNSLKSGSSWTDSRLYMYHSKSFNLSIVVEKRLRIRIQNASALCEEGDRSSTSKNLYLSSTHICRNNSHLKTVNVDQIKDLIHGGIIRSGANYIIDSFNETDWNNSDFLCGFWRNESKEFLWENCSLSRPFVCYVGLPKYTVLQAFYTSEDAHWTNNDSLSRQTSETVDLPIYTIQRASYTSMDLTFRKYDSSRHSASEKVSSGIWSATEARPSRTVSLTYTSVLHVQNTSKEANNTTHHDQKSIIIAAVTSGICLAALTISVIVVCKRKYRQKSRAPENEYTCLTTRSQPLEQVYEDLGRGNHEEEPEPLNHDNRSFIDEESEGKFSLTKAFPENTDSMLEETYDVIHE